MHQPLTDDDAAAKRFEANQIFTPSHPINLAELFAGRSRQIIQMLDTIAEPGRVSNPLIPLVRRTS